MGNTQTKKETGQQIFDIDFSTQKLCTQFEKGLA